MVVLVMAYVLYEDHFYDSIKVVFELGNSSKYVLAVDRGVFSFGKYSDM